MEVEGSHGGVKGQTLSGARQERKKVLITTLDACLSISGCRSEQAGREGERPPDPPDWSFRSVTAPENTERSIHDPKQPPDLVVCLFMLHC